MLLHYVSCKINILPITGAFQCASPIMSILTDFKAGEYCLPGTGEEFCWGQSKLYLQGHDHNQEKLYLELKQNYFFRLRL